MTLKKSPQVASQATAAAVLSSSKTPTKTTPKKRAKPKGHAVVYLDHARVDLMHCIADGLFHALPILGLGRELVAGDDGPLLHIDVLVGQQDVSGIESELTEFFVHGVSS